MILVATDPRDQPNVRIKNEFIFTQIDRYRWRWKEEQFKCFTVKSTYKPKAQ